MNKNPLPELWSLYRAAEYLGVTTRTIFNWRSQGLLRAYRVGRRSIRVAREDVETFLREGADR